MLISIEEKLNFTTRYRLFMYDIYKPIRSKSYSVSCEFCRIGPSICIPKLLDNALDKVVQRKRAIVKNEIFVNEGTQLDKLYIINSGAVKTYITVEDKEQINGFYLPGDIIGLDSIHSLKNNNSVKALTNTLVCELKYNELMELVSQNIHTRDTLLKLMSEDIHDVKKLILSFSQKNAEEKVASFIYSLYIRYARRAHVSLNIKLAMSRSDIANYLGLTIETISRILTRMQDLNILTARGKYITINNLTALIKFAEYHK